MYTHVVDEFKVCLWHKTFRRNCFRETSPLPPLPPCSFRVILQVSDVNWGGWSVVIQFNPLKNL